MFRWFCCGCGLTSDSRCIPQSAQVELRIQDLVWSTFWILPGLWAEVRDLDEQRASNYLGEPLLEPRAVRRQRFRFRVRRFRAFRV